MAITPPVWVIKVGTATAEFNSGNPPSANETKQTVNGTLQDISFLMEGIQDMGSSILATISYQRTLQSEAVSIRRRALVEITLNGDIVFAGVVNKQTRTHSKVTLNCISQVDLLNLAPIFGAIRDHSSGTTLRYFQTALSIFNEKGLPDKSLGNLSGVIFGALEHFNIPRTRWNISTVIKHLLADLMPNNLDPLFTAHIDPIDIADVINNNIGVFNVAENDLIIRGGIIDEIVNMIDGKGDNGHIADFTPNASFPSPPDYKLNIIEKYDPAFEKSIIYNKDAKSSDEDSLKGTTFQINLNDDFASPTKIIISSGRKFITTMLTIKPKTSENYVVEREADDKTGELLFFGETIPESGNLVFESNEILGDNSNSYTLLDLHQSGKVGTIVSINPRFAVEPIVGEEITFGDQEIYVDFKQNQVLGISPQREVLIGGKAWVDARGNKGTGLLDFLESLNFEIDQDNLRLTISGLIKEGGSFNSAINRIKNNVDFFHIPVTIEIENRVVVVVTKNDGPGIPTFSSKILPDSDLPELNDMIKESIIYEIRDDLRPIEFLFGFDSYSETTGIELKTEKTSFQNDLRDQLAIIGETTLKEAIFNDGSSMDMIIPLELVPKLGSEFPQNIGDWITEIQGDDGNAGYGLNRPLIIKSKSYSIDSLTLNFS